MTPATFINSGALESPLEPVRTLLRLLPSGDGWSLVTIDGRLVFSALGLAGRQRCLEFAQAGGVGVLVSDH